MQRKAAEKTVEWRNTVPARQKVFLLDRPRPVLFFKKENGGRNRSPAGTAGTRPALGRKVWETILLTKQKTEYKIPLWQAEYPFTSPMVGMGKNTPERRSGVFRFRLAEISCFMLSATATAVATVIPLPWRQEPPGGPSHFTCAGQVNRPLRRDFACRQNARTRLPAGTHGRYEQKHRQEICRQPD